MDAESFVRAFLAAIEAVALVGRDEDWYHADAVQVEYPNRLNPGGTVVRDLAALRLAGERGRAIVERQAYEVVNVVAQGSKVAVEAVFRATFKADVLGLAKGSTMTARFAIFFELRDGRIVRHHTYDCFEPW